MRRALGACMDFPENGKWNRFYRWTRAGGDGSRNKQVVGRDVKRREKQKILGAFGGWYGNLVQCKVPGIYEGDSNEDSY